jgi:hypothetical protein
VPHARLDNAGLTLAEDARLSFPLHGQLTLKNGEALDHRWVAVLAHNTAPDERDELDGCATLWVLPRKLEDGGALAGNRILLHLPDLNRRQVGRAVWVGMRHQADAGCF